MSKAGRKPVTVRAGLGKTALHGVIGWAILIGLVASFLTARLHSAQSYRDPLPPVTVHLSKAEVRQWKTMPMYRRAVPVLEYHGISGPPTYLTISRYLFARQMLALKVAGFHPITIEQYVRFLHGHYRGLPSRPILLTFDDGRLDAYRAALNILGPYHFPATDIVVPGWTKTNIRFSQSWPEMEQLSATGMWDVQAHFGFGNEWVVINKQGKLGGAFADLEWIEGRKGKPGHLETFAHFKKRFTTNMLFAIKQLRLHIPGYRPLAMAIPRGDYGEAYTNDDRIPRFVVSWLDRHFDAVFGGDYLAKSKKEKHWIGGRYGRLTKRIAYRMTMGERDILPVLFCRLKDYALDTPTWREYLCYHRTHQKGSNSSDPDGDGGKSLGPLSPALWREPAGRQPLSASSPSSHSA